MSELKHTPGPWEVEDVERDDDELIRICDRNGSPVAIVPDEFGPDSGSLSEDVANARLIAAAPEMLAVLLRALDDPRLPLCLVGEVRSAVGSALGWSWERVADDAGEGRRRE